MSSRGVASAESASLYDSKKFVPCRAKSTVIYPVRGRISHNGCAKDGEYGIFAITCENGELCLKRPAGSCFMLSLTTEEGDPKLKVSFAYAASRD